MRAWPWRRVMRRLKTTWCLPLMMAWALVGCADDPVPTIDDVTVFPAVLFETGPYGVQARVSDRRGVSAATLVWQVRDDGDRVVREGATSMFLLYRYRGDQRVRVGADLPMVEFGQSLVYFVEGIATDGTVSRYPASLATGLQFRYGEGSGPEPDVIGPDDDADEPPDVLDPDVDDPIVDVIEPDVIEPVPDCEVDADCPPGDRCNAARGTCFTPGGCAISGECPVGYLCRDGACRPSGEDPSQGCRGPGDCEEGLACRFGVCVPDRCEGDGDCPGNQRCVLGECFSGNLPIPPGCQVEADCGVDEQCVLGICLPRQCRRTRDCASGETCIRGFCAPFDLPIPIPIDECITDRDCRGLFGRCVAGICLPNLPFLPDGCERDSDCSDRQVCLANLCVDAQCRTRADCPSGQDCLFGFCTPEDLPLPIPGSCSRDADCPSGAQCLATVCVPDSLPIPSTCGPGNPCPGGRPCTFGFCLPFDLPFPLPFGP